MTTATITKSKNIFCRLSCKKISAHVNLSAVSKVFANLKNPSIIGANSARKNNARFSYWVANPLEIFEFNYRQKQPFIKLQKTLNKYILENNTTHTLPKGIFTGGWIGFFSYDLGRYIENIPDNVTDDLKMPLIRLCFYDKLIAYDHHKDRFWLIVLEHGNDNETVQQKFSCLENLLAIASEINPMLPPAGDLENIDFSNIKCNMDKDYYLTAIKKIKKYILDGDVYQINFSQRFQCDYNSNPIELFNWQNHYNPSEYSAYIDSGTFQIVSASPEMFITIKDRNISTKPIKGTRPRTGKEALDYQNYNELLNSLKEQAELNMIVDLERNDLARICIPGTRKVIQPRTIETYPTIFHAVATVAGKLRADISFCDILKAMFPGGSITGAPKVSSMEIIDETEPTARGVYTGSIGLIGLDGNISLNIAIRTIITKDNKAYTQTGGGIVADSDPQDEWNKTITKARALLAGIIATK